MLPNQAGACWEIFTPAKLNLYLEVLGPRADGFHALETLMVPVRIFDQLRWHAGAADSSLELRVRGFLPNVAHGDQLLGAHNNNLVLRAARLLAVTAGVAPRGQFDLVKRIPIQAGMGGGSSDAAAALLLANKAWGLDYSLEQLQLLAAELGSDVPFFLRSQAAICRGRGELIEPVSQLPRLHFVIVKPPVGLSTAAVFGQMPAQNTNSEALAADSRFRLAQLLSNLRCGNLAAAGQAMINRLEFAAVSIAPWLVRLREIFSSLGCQGHLMTGSGSAYVGVMRSATHARAVAQRLAGMKLNGDIDIGNVFATSNC